MKKYLIACLSILLTGNLATAGIIGVSFGLTNSSVSTVNEMDGTGAFLGNSGVARLNSLARNGVGTLYSVGGRTDRQLVTIDPMTGAATTVVNLNATDIRGLAFVGNTLFGIRNTVPGSTTSIDDLVSINTATGIVTTVGPTGLSSIQGLAANPAGRLFGWDLREGLVAVNPMTGLAATIGGPGGTFGIQALAFDPMGTLYGAQNSLYTIDTATGARTLVGSGGYSDLRGIEFLVDPPAVPEPGSLLVWSSLLGVSMMRRRRK